MTGKGDKQRPTDHKAFSNNYDSIFSKTKEDWRAEDEEFERIEREQRDRRVEQLEETVGRLEKVVRSLDRAQLTGKK
jgi:uncharacterized FlaG/YvyC family protein